MYEPTGALTMAMKAKSASVYVAAPAIDDSAGSMQSEQGWHNSGSAVPPGPQWQPPRQDVEILTGTALKGPASGLLAVILQGAYCGLMI